jgi:hypothetical protein
MNLLEVKPGAPVCDGFGTGFDRSPSALPSAPEKIRAWTPVMAPDDVLRVIVATSTSSTPSDETSAAIAMLSPNKPSPAGQRRSNRVTPLAPSTTTIRPSEPRKDPGLTKILSFTPS